MSSCPIQPQFGSNFAIFVLFFGMSLLDAFRGHNWITAGLWLLGAAMFLAADLYVAHKNRRQAPVRQ